MFIALKDEHGNVLLSAKKAPAEEEPEEPEAPLIDLLELIYKSQAATWTKLEDWIKGQPPKDRNQSKWVTRCFSKYKSIYDHFITIIATWFIINHKMDNIFEMEWETVRKGIIDMYMKENQEDEDIYINLPIVMFESVDVQQMTKASIPFFFGGQVETSIIFIDHNIEPTQEEINNNEVEVAIFMGSPSESPFSVGFGGTKMAHFKIDLHDLFGGEPVSTFQLGYAWKKPDDNSFTSLGIYARAAGQDKNVAVHTIYTQYNNYFKSVYDKVCHLEELSNSVLQNWAYTNADVFYVDILRLCDLLGISSSFDIIDQIKPNNIREHYGLPKVEEDSSCDEEEDNN